MTELDETLIFRAKRAGGRRWLTREERVAIALLKRKGVKVSVLMRVFGCSKNTIYYKRKTPRLIDGEKLDVTAETRALIRRIGLKEAWDQFITPEIAAAVDRENKVELELK